MTLGSPHVPFSSPLQAAEQPWPAPSKPLHPAETSVARYLLLLLLAGGIAGFILTGAYLLDMMSLGLMLIGILLMGLTLWRVEMGLFVLTAMIPWEAQAIIFQELTAIKAAGILVALLALPRILSSRGAAWPITMTLAFGYGVWAFVGQLFNLPESLLPIFWGMSALLSNIAMVYLVTRFCSTPNTFQALLWAAALSAMGVAVAGLVAASGHNIAWRLTSGMEVNTYVKFLFLSVFIGPLLIGLSRGLALRLLLAGGLLATLAALIRTGSRGASLGAVVGGVVLIVTMKGVRLSTKLIVVALAALLLAGAFYWAEAMGASELWAERLSASNVQASQDTRWYRWGLGLEIAMDHPVFGVGTSIQEGMAYAQYGFRFTEAHNDFISTMIRTGVPGGLLFLGLVVLNFRDLWRLPSGLMRAGLLGMWAAFVVTGIFNPSLHRKVFWLAIGISAAAIACYRSAASPSPPPGPSLVRPPQA